MSSEPQGKDGGPETGVIVPRGGQIARQDLMGSSLEISGETAGTALAARARATVEARFVVAMRRPRDIDDVRTKLLRACERPGFAGSMTEKVWGAAWYRKPVGEGVEGFSIRFAEEALRAMTNIDVETVTVYDDDYKRILMVSVTDLESNLSFPTAITVTKTVERKRLRKGEVALKTRVNSFGEPTYIVEATEDDVFTKQQNLVSKAIRNGALRILPGDIQGECRKRILEIRLGDVAKDPDGMRRKIADGFAALNVPPSQLKEYLGHELATATPAELADLRDLWNDLKEGKTTWVAVMEALAEETGAETPEATPQKKSGLEGLTDQLKAQATAAAPASAAASEHPADASGAEKEVVVPPVAQATSTEPSGSGPFAKAVAAVTGRRGTQKTLEE